MSLLAYKLQVLTILAENLKNAQPQVVDSRCIADMLKMSLTETCQLIMVMNAMGIVQSDPDGQRSLITREGLDYLDTMNYRRAA